MLFIKGRQKKRLVTLILSLIVFGIFHILHDVTSTQQASSTIVPPVIEKNPTSAGNYTPSFTLWDHETNSITIPNKRPGAPLTSLEILEQVLKNNQNLKTNEPSCFVPNIEATTALVDLNETLDLPVLNLGMPKCGSTTLLDFFRCAGFNANHGQNGKCMEQAVLDGKPPISGCKGTNSLDVLCQLDNNFEGCSYPQITLLDEIHREFPRASFVLPFRPVNDWIRSARDYHNMESRWNNCLLPGLVKKQKQLSKQDIRNWWCGHVNHVREFVKRHPTHKLVELDLYDAQSSSKALASLFNADASCWGHSNSNVRKRKKWRTVFDKLLDWFGG